MRHTTLSLILFSVFLFCIDSTAQSTTNNSLAGLDDYLISNFDDSKSLSTPKAKKVYKAIAFDVKALKINVSADFGSYLIPNTNLLKVVNKSVGKYNRAELINKKTGQFIFKVAISKEKDTIDMTGTPSGLYRLILSNDNGEKTTEDIVIMQ